MSSTCKESLSAVSNLLEVFLKVLQLFFFQTFLDGSSQESVLGGYRHIRLLIIILSELASMRGSNFLETINEQKPSRKLLLL